MHRVAVLQSERHFDLFHVQIQYISQLKPNERSQTVLVYPTAVYQPQQYLGNHM